MQRQVKESAREALRVDTVLVSGTGVSVTHEILDVWGFNMQANGSGFEMETVA